MYRIRFSVRKAFPSKNEVKNSILLLTFNRNEHVNRLGLYRRKS